MDRRNLKTLSLCLVLTTALLVGGGCTTLSQFDEADAGGDTADVDGVDPTPLLLSEIAMEDVSRVSIYSWDDLPVASERESIVSFDRPEGTTHYYEVVYLPDGDVTWIAAAALAEEAGGYLASATSAEESEFLFGLISDEKFWYQWDETHNYVMHGPFLGGFQVDGSTEPDGGWMWLSGETWSYTNWAYDGMEGDDDPRPNDQPNDATGDQAVICFGEVNQPVSTWGDFPARFGDSTGGEGAVVYGFIIEYNTQP